MKKISRGYTLIELVLALAICSVWGFGLYLIYLVVAALRKYIGA